MKKLILLMMIAIFAGYVVESAKAAPPPVKTELVLTPQDCPATYVAMVSPGTQDVAPPDVGDILDLPGKGDGWAGWLDWIIGAAVFIVYEIMVRIKPTSKTYSILGLLYSLLNWFKSDKAKTGANFKINPG